MQTCPRCQALISVSRSFSSSPSREQAECLHLGAQTMSTGMTKSACANGGKAESQLQGGAKLLRCGRCKSASYCSKECQAQAWKGHKATCVPSFQQNELSGDASTEKQVVLVMLEDYSWLGDMYESLYAPMRKACDLLTATTANDAINKIAANPIAVIVFEPAIMKQSKRRKHDALHQTTVAYAKAGGTVIFACQCSQHVLSPDLAWYFENVWDLPWEIWRLC